VIPIWIFTREGFFSAVQDRNNKNRLCVRTRRRGDLERLAKAMRCRLSIKANVGTDYQFRASVNRKQFERYVEQSVRDITYITGVKDQIDCGESDRHSALYRVWDAMMSLQEGSSRYSGFGTRTLGSLIDERPRWDDYFDAPVEADEVVDVVPTEDGRFEVQLIRASGAPTVVNSFLTRTDANNLAMAIRDTVATWDGFVDYYSDNDEDEELYAAG